MENTNCYFYKILFKSMFERVEQSLSTQKKEANSKYLLRFRFSFSIYILYKGLVLFALKFNCHCFPRKLKLNVRFYGRFSLNISFFLVFTELYFTRKRGKLVYSTRPIIIYWNWYLNVWGFIYFYLLGT